MTVNVLEVRAAPAFVPGLVIEIEADYSRVDDDGLRRMGAGGEL